MNPQTCRRARLARDHRFDGTFFVAVKTTGIYCRPICPAPAPKEANVVYFDSAIAAANQGFRPCLRCRPDSAPASFTWKGTDTTLERALRLIDEGVLIDGSVTHLAERLGIGSRYLTKLFQQKLGTSPKQYALYQQLLFAKSLLQQTALPITEVAFASGFASVRRFNDCFARTLQLTPSAIRRSVHSEAQGRLRLFLSYRPPYAWTAMRDFLLARLIPGLEWCDEHHYGRTFRHETGATGHFTARHRPQRFGFDVSIELTEPAPVWPVVRTIRRVLDLDADIRLIDQHLSQLPGPDGRWQAGLRLPGIWSPFEAGVRAVLGQQITVAGARRLVTELVSQLGEPCGDMYLFPSPERLARSTLDTLKMPDSRRRTLLRLARHCIQHGAQCDPHDWLAILGIGPWTVNYASLRGKSDSDVWLDSDLGIRKALRRHDIELDPSDASPWRSYLTLQLWNLL